MLKSKHATLAKKYFILEVIVQKKPTRYSSLPGKVERAKQ